MKFAILALLVLVVIVFFVFIWKSSRDWRWYNLTAASFNMLLAIGLLFPTAGTLKSRSAWHEMKEDLEKRVVQAKDENKRLKYGTDTAEGILALNSRLAKLDLEAGRRWRGLQLRGFNNNLITLASGQAAAPPAADPAADPNATPDDGTGTDGAPVPVVDQKLIPEQMIVYGFAQALTADQIAVPVFYLGEFIVQSSTANQVTLRPTGVLEPAQQQRITGNQAGNWIVYESLPADGHEPFIAEGSTERDDNYLGRVDEDTIRGLMGNNVTPETLKAYLEDGRRATQEDPPVSRWTKIEFNRTYTMDVDSPEQRGALDGGFFDGSGRAVDSRLQRGEEGNVSFKKGEQILVKEEGGNQLIDDGVAKLVDKFYLRPLNDYRFALRRIRLRINELADRTKELEFEKSVLTEAEERTTRMQVVNREVKRKLEQDFAQFRTERQVMETYTAEMEKKVKDLRAELMRLHRENLALESRIRDQQVAGASSGSGYIQTSLAK